MTIEYSPHRAPHFNHVAMSVSAELLNEENRSAIIDFYGKVFGWEELPTMTLDRERLVLSCHTYEQFVFLIADDKPMTAPAMDHYGMSVSAEADLDEVWHRAQAYQHHDARVKIIDKKTDDFEVLTITSIYIGFLLPMMVELQWWNFIDAKN